MTAGVGVSQRSEFLIVNRDRRSVTPLRVVLGWHPAEPFTVTVRFPKGVVWELSRELVIEGLTSLAAGEGDVRFSRLDDCGCVLLTLDSTSGHAVLHVPRADLIDFVVATEFLPRADLVTEFDFDAWLRQLRQELAS